MPIAASGVPRPWCRGVSVVDKARRHRESVTQQTSLRALKKNSLMKRLVKLAVRKLGFDLRRIDRSALSQDGVYDVIVPRATYSPWNKDAAFKKMYEAIRESTMVDEYRCFELWKLVAQSAKLKDGHVIEIGVWRGGTGALIATQAQNCGIHGMVYLCDTFTGVVKAGRNDSSYRGGEHRDTSGRSVERLLSSLHVDNVCILQGVFPDETGQEIEGLQFRFCHIDVDVYQSAAEILDWVWNRMVRGGIIVYDDYGFRSCDGITKHVEEQIPSQSVP